MDPVHDFISLKESIEDSLKDFDMQELQQMNDDLVLLIDSLIQRQLALQEVILDRLNKVFDES
jgi:hypothetical protein